MSFSYLGFLPFCPYTVSNINPGDYPNLYTEITGDGLALAVWRVRAWKMLSGTASLYVRLKAKISVHPDPPQYEEKQGTAIYNADGANVWMGHGKQDEHQLIVCNTYKIMDKPSGWYNQTVYGNEGPLSITGDVDASATHGPSNPYNAVINGALLHNGKFYVSNPWTWYFDCSVSIGRKSVSSGVATHPEYAGQPTGKFLHILPSATSSLSHAIAKMPIYKAGSASFVPVEDEEYSFSSSVSDIAICPYKYFTYGGKYNEDTGLPV